MIKHFFYLDKVQIENCAKALDVPVSLKHKATDEAADGLTAKMKRMKLGNNPEQKKKVAVLISGTGGFSMLKIGISSWNMAINFILM